MRWSRALVVLPLALAVAACGKRQVEGSYVAAAPVEAQRSEAVGDRAPASAAEAGGLAPAGGAGVAPAAGGALEALWAEQKLIRDGRIEVEVDDVEATVARIGEVAAARRALVAGSEIRKDASGRRTGSVILKVPAGAFEATLADLRGIGRVRGESTSTEDVTKEYTDLGIRLDVKRRTRERLEVLMATRSAELEDLLQVERELERVVGEIERMEGEKRYYDQRIAVSTITLALFEPETAVPGPGALGPIREAVRDALYVLSQSIAVLIYVVTSALPWALLAWVLWKVVARVRRRRAARSAS